MNKQYHLIGIGGIGMSGIAQLLLRCGIKVSGSDAKDSFVTRQLASQGAKVFIGHNSKNIENADLVIYSSAIKDDNPEIIEARKRNIPLIRRAEALAQLMQDKTVITVTGSHGKTTTTSLISYMLLEAGLSPTVAIGGILRNIDTNACLGNGRYFVAEADESDGSFLYYRPKYSVITNIDAEHLDYYKNFDNEVRAFEEFLGRTDKDGCVFCCGDDPQLRRLSSNYRNKYFLFGTKEDCDIYPKNVLMNGLNSEFDCYYKGKFIDRFSLALGGMHNISNSLSVIALGLELGISLAVIKKSLSGYKGAKRRLEVKYSDKDYLVIDDYAHHPTEIKMTLAAVKALNKKRIIAVFQPHRYSRTKLLLDEFVKSFDAADYVIITDIYAASEKPIEGIDAKLVRDRVAGNYPGKTVVYVAKEELVAHISSVLAPQDLVITLGAGDIVKVSDELPEKIKVPA